MPDTWLPDPWIIVVLIAGAAATYVWRALGVALSGRIDPTGPVFEWVGCVAYALLAALIARMIVMPVGPLEATDLGSRLISAAIALVAFFPCAQKHLLRRDRRHPCLYRLHHGGHQALLTTLATIPCVDEKQWTEFERLGATRYGRSQVSTASFILGRLLVS